MLAAAGTACDVAARCAVTGREQQQRQGEEFVGIHPPASMEQGCVQVGTACPGVRVLAGTLGWSSAPLRAGTGDPQLSGVQSSVNPCGIFFSPGSGTQVPLCPEG